jgi:hypothetical protein
MHESMRAVCNIDIDIFYHYSSLLSAFLRVCLIRVQKARATRRTGNTTKHATHTRSDSCSPLFNHKFRIIFSLLGKQVPITGGRKKEDCSKRNMFL